MRARFSYIETISSSILNVKCKTVEGLAKGYLLWQPMMLLMSKFFYHTNCGVIKEFPALKKSRNNTREKISYFSTCVDIANQLLTRHSPLAPLGQVNE